MNDNKQKLYDAISGDYDVGTFDAFSRRLDNENDRRQLYDAISGDYDVGDYDTFSSKLGYGGVTDKGATMKSNAFGSMATWQNPTFGQPQTGAYTPGMGPTLAQAEAVQQENFQAAKNAVKEKAAKAKVSQAMAKAGIRPDLETIQAQAIPEENRLTPEQREEYLAGAEAMRSDVEQSLEGLGSAAEETLNPDLKQLYGPKTNEQIKEEAFAEGAQMKADEDARKKFYDSVDLPMRKKMRADGTLDPEGRDDGTLDLDAITEQAGEKVREYGGLYNYYDKQPMALTPDETKKMVEARYRRDASDLVSKYARLSRGLEQAKNGEASAFWTGFKNNTVEDIFSAGLSSAYDMGILYDIVKRASKGEKLYPEEQQAIVLYGTNQDFLDAVSKDSKWFDIGNGLRTSLELMGQIALTGGTSGATTMSAQGIKNSFKLAQQFAKKYGTKDVLKIAAKEGKKIVPKFTKEGVRNYGRALGNAFVRDMGLTLATPMTFKMLGENMVGLYDFGEGFDENGNYGVSARRNDKGVGEAMWDAYVGSLMERFSESWGGVTDNATDFWRVVRSPKAGGLVGKLSRHLGMGELGWKRAKRMLRTVGVNNIGTEAAEEVIGDLGKFALTWDTENLKELLDPDFYTQVAATSVFLGGFGNVISSAAGSMGRYEYDKRKERGYRERLSNYKSAQLDVIPSDNTVDQKAADMQAHLADALEKEQFMDKNADFNNGEVFKAFQDIKDYAAEGEKAYLDGKMSEEDYLAREQLALESQEIIYEGLQRYGGQEALMESLQDDIGEYRNRTTKGQDVIIVRSKDDGSLKYLLDNKGEVAVVRDITGGKDGQPTTMKNTEYEVASVTPAQRYAANVYAVGEDMAKEAAVKAGAADTGVERYNQYQGGQWNPIQTQTQVDEAAAAAQEAQAAQAQEAQAAEAQTQEAPAAEAPEGEVAQEAAPAAETPAFQPGQTAYLNGEEVEVLGAYNDGQVAVLTEDGRELVDASALSATPDAAPAEESAQPETAPETPLEEALGEVAQEQEAPLPMRKNGKIDFNALLEQDPSRFIVEYDKAYGAGKGTEKLLQAQQSLNEQIEKAQKAVDTPTDDMNKAADNEDKLQELQARKAVIDAALQPVEEAVEMVDEIVGQQAEAQPVAEESAQTEAPVAEETPAVEETPAEMTPEAQQNLQQSMDMASGIVNNGPVEATPVVEESAPAESPVQQVETRESLEERLQELEEQQDEERLDYIAEHYPTQATVSAATNSPEGKAERERMRKDPVLREMVQRHRAALEAIEERLRNEFPLEESAAENPDQGRIQESVDMASRAMETAVPKRQEIKEQRELSDSGIKYSKRIGPAPKKTGIGYKVFVLKDGKLYPPMVANPNGVETPVGEWLDADAAPQAGVSKTGRPQVKAGGKGTQGGSGTLAYRPGWHLGEIPYAIQFNRLNPKTGEKDLFPNNFVWAEVEYANDIDYQKEAEAEGVNASGKYQHSLAGLKKVPVDGSYRYRTNPNPATDPWIITGAMKVNRILSREEVNDMVRKAGREPQPIQEGDVLTQEEVDKINNKIKEQSQKVKEQKKLSDTEAARRRAIRDAVVEKLRKAKIDVITDEKEGQAILRAYRDLWKHAVLHGSGALFDRFDHKFMGSGEGAQYYGWGTYVTEVPGIAKNYARSSAKLSKEDQERREKLWDKRAELFSEKDKLDDYFRRKQTVDGAVSAIDYLNGLSDERYKILYDAAQSIKAKYSGSWSYPFGVAEQNGDLAIFGFDQLGAVEFLFETQGELYNELRQNPDAFSGIDSVEEFEERLKERKSEIDSKFQESRKRRDEIISELGDTEDELSEIDKRASSYLYEVEIPDDNGNNYITYGKELSPEQKKRLKDAIRERLLADPESGYNEKNLRELNEDLDSSFDNIYGNDVEGTVRDLLGVNDRGASEFLSDLGYAGIKYPAMYRSGGRSDGASNFVIFDEGDLKIKSTAKLFKSPDGQTVYGFTKDGKIYLDPEAPADTPIHEYTHLWAEMFRKINPKEWNNVIKLMKGTDLWDAVKRTYPELTDDADIAEEVLAHYSGRRGAQRIEEEMRRIRGDKNMSESEKFKALTALAKLRRAIEKFWKTIAEYLGMEFTTAEEVADRVLADIDKGINPAEVMKKVEVSDRQYAKAKEVLDYFNSKGFKDGQIVRSITDNGVSTYILGSWGLQPYTKYRISDHPIGSYRQQREISFNENTKPETLYRLGSGRNTLSGEEQQKRATGPSEYDQLWDQHKKDMDGLVFRTWQSPLGLEEALKQKAFLANAKYLQQRMNGDGTYTYEFSEPGEQTLDKRPSLEFLRAMEPAKAEKKTEAKTEVRMQKEMPKENPVKQKVAEVAKKAQAKVEEAKAIRKAKLDEMDGKIKKVNKMLVAAAQRGYDKATVKTVTDLARELVSEGLIDEAGRKTIKSILSLLSKVAGKENIETSVRRLMDIAAENQIRNLKAYMDKLQKTKAMKVNSSGVKVQGRMDLFGQRMLDEYRSLRDADAKTIRERLDNGYDRDDDESLARYIGAKLAYRYATGVAALEEAYKSQKADFETKRREMYKQYRDGKITYQAYREFADEGRRSLLQSRLALLDAYDDMTGRLFKNIAVGMKEAKAFKKKEEEDKDKIHHIANADMEGTSASPFRDEKKKTVFDRSIPSFLLTPVSSFDMLLRQLGRKSVNGQGYLWNHFLRGAIRASGAEYDAIAAGEKELAAKAQELTGKKHWSDLYGGKDTKIDVMVLQDGKLKPMTLTQGNALYIYAVNKMEDGRMKLRAMGIDQAAIDRMMEQVDPRYIKLIDWVQDEFLPKLGKKYAPVYEKLFGAPMDMVENYFPLKIAKGDVEENVDLGHPDAYALPSTMTGAVVRRTKNTKALDLLNADAFDIVLDHLHKMEHWAAFAPLIKDLNTLLSYKRFQNQVKNLNTIYGSGEKLWDEFKKTAEMAVGSYRPVGRGAAADKAAVSISKGVTAAKISFRIFTAIKQLLSMPAYVADANMMNFAKNFVKPAAAWNWCMENLPLFRKRWEGRIAGETRLMDSEFDWGLLKNDVTKAAVKLGISPNAFVDALTVSIGAKSIYETKLKRYLKEGYDKEKAEQLAKEDAQILFNETQQSAEGAFLSSVQLDRTFLAAALSVFRNSSMGYQRQVVDAARNLKHMTEYGYKKEFMDYETKRRMREGVSEEEAKAGAERMYNRAVRHNLVRLAVFGYVLPYFWYMGASLPYFLFGKDDEKKKDMEKEARYHAIAGILEGLSGGNAMSDLWNVIANGNYSKDVQYWDLPSMPVTSDIKNLVQTFARDKVQGYNELINLVVQGGIGVNPQTVTDIINAALDAANGDFNTGREILLAMLKLTQVPQTKLREMYIDELHLDGSEVAKLSVEEIAQRYAQEQVRRNAFLTGFMYGEEDRKKAEKSKIRTFKAKVKERQELLQDKRAAKELGLSQDSGAAKKTLEELMEEVNKAVEQNNRQQ